MTTMDRPFGSIRVRVPGSTSNLGAGFDCIGLALDRYLEVEYRPDSQPLRVAHQGEAPRPGRDDLLHRVLRSRLEARGLRNPIGLVTARSTIPVARGLGSSGAAVIAALRLSEALAPAVEGGESAESVLAAAAHWEGHLDNAAPALMGGLVAVCDDAGGQVRPLRLPLSSDIAFAFAAPGYGVATAQARAALPAAVSHATATRSLGRMAALVHGLATGDPGLLRVGFRDELHVPFRLGLLPGATQACAAGEEAGAWAVTISGSGSGLIAVCPPATAPAVAQAMADAFREDGAPGTSTAFVVAPDFTGAYTQSVEQVCP